MGRVIMGHRELPNSSEKSRECLMTSGRTVGSESEIEALLSELEVLRRENEELRQFASEVHEVRDLPSEEVRALVRDYALGVPKDVPIFASDVAYDLCLDPDAVEEAMEDLCREGFLS